MCQRELHQQQQRTPSEGNELLKRVSKLPLNGLTRSYPTEERGSPPLVLRGKQRTRNGPTFEQAVTR